MGINISAKTDYSALFSSLNSGSSSSSALTDLSWLSDYSSIKSGTYGKLMKAYYNSDESKAEETKASFNKTEATAETKAYTKVSANADALQTSITNLGKLDAKEDSDKAYTQLSSYVENYNALIKSSADVADTSIAGRMTSIKGYTADKSSDLSKIGITVNSNGTLSLDKDTYEKADKSKVNELFAARGSYGYSVSVSAAMVQSSANYDAARTSTYTSTGNYSSVVGSLWDSTT